MSSIIYVIGHKNPDTDSIVSAAAYAHLKRAQGITSCIAARAGRVNPQTDYIFDRFGLPLPEFIPDLVPKVRYYVDEAPETVPADTPLWDALEKLNTEEVKALPIVDEKGHYLSLLHYNAFAQNILKKINPRRKAVVLTTIGHLLKTLRAQPVLTFDEDKEARALIVVGASEFDTFRRHLDAEMPENTLVIVGDRADIQRYALERKVRALIISGGNLLAKDLKDLAEKNRVSVMISPFDTSSTSMLIIYSTPVRSMGDDSVVPVNGSDSMRFARDRLLKTAARALPVVDDAGKVTGLLTEGDLIREPNIGVIMVDHNELGQAVDGIENYRILEIIDHHRLGNMETKYPITFLNKPVGSTSTIVTTLFREQKIPLTREIAGILLCGILSDTLVLKSATTTPTDLETAEYLAGITGLEIEALGNDIQHATSAVLGKPASEIIGMDMKEYTMMEKGFSVSQVEVNAFEDIAGRYGEFRDGLRELAERRGFFFSALMVTNITDLTSVLVIEGDRDFIGEINLPKSAEGAFVLQDIVSRKKQLMPVLFELVERSLR